MAAPSAIAVRRSPGVLKAQEEQQAAETSHSLAARGLTRQLAKTKGQDYKPIFPPLKQAAPHVPPAPTPRKRCVKPPSVASTLGTVTAESLIAAKQHLISAAQHLTEKTVALVAKIESRVRNKTKEKFSTYQASA